jgi:hypothetical protein
MRWPRLLQAPSRPSGGQWGRLLAPGDSAEDRGLRRVAIRLQMTAELGSLVRVLHGLETGIPLLFVDNLELQSQVAASIGRRRAGAPLIVDFDLYGYLPPVRL